MVMRDFRFCHKRELRFEFRKCPDILPFPLRKQCSQNNGRILIQQMRLFYRWKQLLLNKLQWMNFLCN